MADRFVDPGAPTNGDGLTLATAYNTFAGLTWGAHTYYVAPGTLAESIVFGANGATVTALDRDNPPTIDGASLGASTSTINFNSRTGCAVSHLIVIGSTATSPNAAVRVSGSNNRIHHLKLKNNRAGIQVNSGGHRIYKNEIDVGHVDIPTIGYGIRLNSASTTGTRVYQNVITCSSLDGRTFVEGATFRSAIESYQATGNLIYRNRVAAKYSDQILILESSNTKVYANDVGVRGALDGIGVRQSSGIDVYNNVSRHFYLWDHAGPALTIGDNFGTGTITTNSSFRNNLLVADFNLPLAYKPAGSGNVFAGNILWRTGGSGDAVVNYQATQGGAVSSLNMADWLALGLDTGSQAVDPEEMDDGTPAVGSPLLTGGADIGPVPDALGRVGRSYVGAYGPSIQRAVAIARAQASARAVAAVRS